MVGIYISSRLDDCNSLLMNGSKSNLCKLQQVQNAAARLVVRAKKRTSTSDILKKLHWLRVESRIFTRSCCWCSCHYMNNAQRPWESSSNPTMDGQCWKPVKTKRNTGNKHSPTQDPKCGMLCLLI